MRRQLSCTIIAGLLLTATSLFLHFSTAYADPAQPVAGAADLLAVTSDCPGITIAHTAAPMLAAAVDSEVTDSETEQPTASIWPYIAPAELATTLVESSVDSVVTEGVGRVITVTPAKTDGATPAHWVGT